MTVLQLSQCLFIPVIMKALREREICENLNSEIEAKLNRVSLHGCECSPLSLEPQPFQSRLSNFEFGRFHPLYSSDSLVEPILLIVLFYVTPVDS